MFFFCKHFLLFQTASVTSNTSVDSQTEEVIKQLQEELVSVRLKAADQSCNVKELLDKIRELDNVSGTVLCLSLTYSYLACT